MLELYLLEIYWATGLSLRNRSIAKVEGGRLSPYFIPISRDYWFSIHRGKRLRRRI